MVQVADQAAVQADAQLDVPLVRRQAVAATVQVADPAVDQATAQAADQAVVASELFEFVAHADQAVATVQVAVQAVAATATKTVVLPNTRKTVSQ